MTCGQAHRSAARARPGALARLRREAGQHAGRVLFSMTGSAASWFGAPSGGATSSCSSAKSSSSVAMAAQTPSAPRPELVTQPESWGRHIVSPISSARNDSLMMGNRRNDKPLTQSRTNYFQGQIFRRGGRRDGHCAVRARGPADRRHFGRQGAPGARAHTSCARGGQSAQARTRAVRCGHRCCRACVRACVRARALRAQAAGTGAAVPDFGAVPDRAGGAVCSGAQLAAGVVVECRSAHVRRAGDRTQPPAPPAPPPPCLSPPTMRPAPPSCHLRPLRMVPPQVNARRATYSHKAAVLDACWGADQVIPSLAPSLPPPVCPLAGPILRWPRLPRAGQLMLCPHFQQRLTSLDGASSRTRMHTHARRTDAFLGAWTAQ